MPPGINLTAALGGFLALVRFRRSGIMCLTLAWVSLYAFSLFPVAAALHRGLQTHPPLADGTASGAQAIVVLGASTSIAVPEYGGADTVSPNTLNRIRYGAWLHRRTGLPILVTGGRVVDGIAPAAELMAATLRDEFTVPVRWIEPRARNTAENAAYSAGLLEPDGVSHVLLVTHSFHMRRSVEAFEQTGLRVTPAPISLVRSRGDLSLHDFMPNARALAWSREALYEYLGRFWYRIRYRQ